MIDVDHQQRQFAAILLRLHPLEIEPALEAAAVGESGQHVDGGHYGEAIVGRQHLALALAEARCHRVEGARQRHELGRHTVACDARRPVALAEAFGHAGHHLDRLDDQFFRADQRAEQYEQADQGELQIGGADLTIDRGGHLALVDAHHQPRLRARYAHEAQVAPGTVCGRERQRAFRRIGEKRLVGDRGHQRKRIDGTADQTGKIVGRGENGALAVDHDGGEAGVAGKPRHALRHPVQRDAGDDDGILLGIDGRYGVGRHHHRYVGLLGDQEIAEDEIAALSRLLEVRPVTDVEPDRRIQHRALHAPVGAHRHDIADPGQVERKAHAHQVAAATDTAGGADIGG